MKPSTAMRSKPIRIKSGQMGGNNGGTSQHRHSIHMHDNTNNMMMATSLDNYSHRGHRSFRNSGMRHG
jgi:hypothetical protein